MDWLKQKSVAADKVSEPLSARVRVKWLAPETIEMWWTGHVDGAAIEEAYQQMEKLVGKHPVRFLVPNTVDVVNFAPSVRNPAKQVLAFVKDHGITHLVGVMPWSPLRLLTSTLSAVVGVKAHLFADRSEAARFLQTAGVKVKEVDFF